MADFEQPPLSPVRQPPQGGPSTVPQAPRGFARGLSGAAVLAALTLACAAAPLMADGSTIRRLDADPVAAALLDGRGSLSFALLAAVLGGLAGIVWALLAFLLGALRGDPARRRSIAAAERLAGLPLALLVPAAGGLFGGLWPLALVTAATAAPAVAVLAHAEISALTRAEFLNAARAAALPEPAVMRRHLVPNALRPLLAAATLALPRVLAAESFASLLGLGLPPTLGSWGASVGLAARLGDPLGLAPPALLLALALWSACAVADAAVAGSRKP
ncbi:ABC transporter permease subunit [Azospirillum picis]|uniref:Oligopeptide transport system permease protein n=1 Tax=Azospirillum picis TaxID=488438 RepID=A0ABU0MDM9_9PROT|nr:ABC transporter permease subunit [Azospirillum picis]MBP2297450.1 oligopeptide transport system permease protein [Azospirillum picis]MDQ0531527.1 oligopeptide transport system permease protein [Azospirillum picis]